jgi:predicted transcriptional regulator
MVRTTIVLPDEDFRELKALAEAQDRSISWLLREAFRLSKGSLQRPESFAQSFDRVWTDIGLALRDAGVKRADVPRLIGTVRKTRAPAPKGKTR